MKVHAVISAPRVGFTRNFISMYRALMPLGIVLDEYAKHAYWHQSLSRKLEDVIEAGYDAALVIDFDSIFATGHVVEMLDIFEKNPWIDALMPVQQRRGGADVPLFTQKDDMGLATRNLKSDERDERVAQCESGHFGMTLLRLDKLSQTSRPWFFDIPNVDGRWEDEESQSTLYSYPPDPWPKETKLACACPSGDLVRFHIEAIRSLMGVPKSSKVDNDIWFWKQWRRCGNSLFVARDVSIGHLQEVVTMSTARTHQDYNLDPDAFFAVHESRAVEA